MNLPVPAAVADSSEVNLTPMLDVVFILLIFFVVTATFMREFGVEVGLPAPPVDKPAEVESIVVRVDAAGTFVVNARAVSRAGLVPYLQYLHARNPDAGFAVLVAPRGRVDDTVTAIDAGRRLGFDVVPISVDD